MKASYGPNKVKKQVVQISRKLKKNNRPSSFQMNPRNKRHKINMNNLNIKNKK